MKATLEFDLPEDNRSHLLAVHAMDWALVVKELDETLRRWLKHGHDFEYPDEALQELRDELLEDIFERGIDLDAIE